MVSDNLTCELLAYRIYGQPKLSKPKLLKGLKPDWKQKVLGKPADTYFLENGTIVVYFGALFCKHMKFPEPVDMALPTAALMKKYPDRFEGVGRKRVKGFLYPDGWSTLWERNEGYVLIKGLRANLKPSKRLFNNPYPPQIAADLFNKFAYLSAMDNGFLNIHNEVDMMSGEYLRFFDDLTWKVWEEEKKHEG